MNKPTVTQEQVNEIIENSEITVDTVHDKVTRVTCKLPNGWVLGEVTGAVSKENYDEEIGRKICMRKIESQIWQLEGYRLQANIAENSEATSIGHVLHLIREWGKEKGITGPNAKATANTQFEKLLEEVEELRVGIEKESFDEIEDAIGDCVVVLTLLAELIPQPVNNELGEDPIEFSVEQAIRCAYDVISKRTGKMIDGKFVKDS